MNTSYFSKYKGENSVSIAGKCPDWYRGKQYKKLAPKYDWWKKWHDGEITDDDYIKLYYQTVLSKLNPQEVYDELGNDAVLLCWESANKFCHRHIVANWLKLTLNIDVVEL